MLIHSIPTSHSIATRPKLPIVTKSALKRTLYSGYSIEGDKPEPLYSYEMQGGITLEEHVGSWYLFLVERATGEVLVESLRERDKEKNIRAIKGAA